MNKEQDMAVPFCLKAHFMKEISHPCNITTVRDSTEYTYND